MTDEKRKFKGVWIPAFVYLNRDVSWNAKVIWLEIDSFTSKGNDCFFSNEHLAEFLGCSKAQVTRYLTELKEAGWVEETLFDGRKRFLRSLLDSSFLMRQDSQGGGDSPGKSDSYTSTQLPFPINTEESKDSSLYKVYDERGEKQKKKKANTEVSHVHQSCIDHWFQVVHPEWTFKTVDGRAAKEIIIQIKKRLEKSVGTFPEEQVLESFKHMCESLPQFYKTQTLMVINTKFDSIIDEIRNGKKAGDWNQRPSAARIINSL